MRLLEALSRSGTRKPLVENLLDAQEGQGTLQRGFHEMTSKDRSD